MIGYSDGTQYDSEFEAMLGPITSDPSTSSRRAVGATEKPAGEFKSSGGTQVPSDDYDMEAAKADGVKPDARGHWPDTYKKPNHITFSDESKFNDGGAGHWEQAQGMWSFTPGPTNLKHHSMDELRQYFRNNEPGSQLVEPKQDEVDRDHHVPLIAAKTPNGIAVDHRVNLAMNFEGKDHDITPFLIAHENAEIDPMESAIKGGMEPKKAYELAHDKVANPAEAAVRNAYAISNGLDVDKFNEAYWGHIEQQKKIAAEPSDKPRHPDAHTTRYGLDPNTKVAMDMEDTPGYLLRHGGQDDTQFGMVAGRSFKGPMIQPKPANENKNLQIDTPEVEWPPKASFNEEQAFKEEQAALKKAQKDFMIKKTNEAYEKASRIPAADQLRDWFKSDK